MSITDRSHTSSPAPTHEDKRSDARFQLERGPIFEEKVQRDDADTASSVESIEYPEGGWRAWLIVLGTMCCTFATFGFVNAWGVFQSYYEINVLQGTSPSTIAWIGSIQYSMVFGPGIVAGRLLDLGYFRVPFATGTLILVVATLLVAQCTEYWHFLLCQGFGVGLGAGMCFGPTLGIVGHWFNKRRGLALGITAVGSSIGGTLYPIAARELIPKVGFPWTMRIMALMNLAVLGISNLTMSPRLPPKNVPGGLLNVRVFRSPAFSIYCVSCLIAFLGMYTVLTYIDTSAIRAGVSPDFSFYLVSIANASSGVGRLLMGMIIDKYGAVNIIAPMSVAAAVLTFAWPHALTQEPLIAIAVLYGFATAAFVSAFGVPIYAMGEMGDVGRRLGTAMLLTGLGALVGPPISGAIIKNTGGFRECSYYAGTAILVSVVMQMWVKKLVKGSFRGKF